LWKTLSAKALREARQIILSQTIHIKKKLGFENSILWQMHQRRVKNICSIGSEPCSYPSTLGIAFEAS